MQEPVGTREETPLDDNAGDDLLARLRAGQLPQMVDWFDPLLLARIGVRTIVSSTMGEYADQRLMQAATDRVDENGLRQRYAYDKVASAQCDCWVDYISDLGDGFEATYAMAYLMAAPKLEIEGASHLLAGQILIMGGDQAYPQSSGIEYQNRLVTPYEAAFTNSSAEANESADVGSALAQRKLFAIPGNHDWYDGLAAFDSLFCSARDRISGGDGKLIGGWRCKQHRSYFAIRLPHNWWIWGADIQLGGVFDDPQRDYFDIMSEEVGPNGKVILCLAEPSWTHENYENLYEIVKLAQKHGGNVCAVLAGDLHHYSHYTVKRAIDPVTRETKTEAAPLKAHFITCGGGGAFTHATHGLKSTVELRWPDNPDGNRPVPEPTNRGPKLSKPEGSLGAAKTTTYELALKDDAIFPSTRTSRLLCLRNLLLPFHNTGFALFVGLVYFLFAWIFNVTMNSYDRDRLLAENTAWHGSAADSYAAVLRRQSNAMLQQDADAEHERQVRTSELLNIASEISQVIMQRRDIENGSAAYLKEGTLTGVGQRIRIASYFAEFRHQLALSDALSELERVAPEAVKGLEDARARIWDSSLQAASRNYIESLQRNLVFNSDTTAAELRLQADKMFGAAQSIFERAQQLLDTKKGTPAYLAVNALHFRAEDVMRHADSLRRTGTVTAISFPDVAQRIWLQTRDPLRVFKASQLNPAFFFLLLGLWTVLVHYADVSTKSWTGVVLKFVLGTGHFVLHVGTLLLVYAIVGPGGAFLTATSLAVVLAAVLGIATGLAFGLSAAYLAGSIALVILTVALQSQLGAPVGAAIDAMYSHLSTTFVDGFQSLYDNFFASPLPKGAMSTAESPAVVFLRMVQEPIQAVVFALVTILLGGLFGALVFGFYWTVMSVLFARHKNDAFGALGIRHYKHFLRMKFERDRVTIYPVAIDKVPGRRGWFSANHAAKKGEVPEHKPRLMPAKPLKPFLIEGPIEIIA